MAPRVRGRFDLTANAYPPRRRTLRKEGSVTTPGWAVGLAVGSVAAGYLVWVLGSNRRAGASGLAREVGLTCPKCGGSFDYRFVPGASHTAMRLGRSRYMACPLCHRWSGFPLIRSGR